MALPEKIEPPVSGVLSVDIPNMSYIVAVYVGSWHRDREEDMRRLATMPMIFEVLGLSRNG